MTKEQAKETGIGSNGYLCRVQCRKFSKLEIYKKLVTHTIIHVLVSEKEKKKMTSTDRHKGEATKILVPDPSTSKLFDTNFYKAKKPHMLVKMISLKFSHLKQISLSKLNLL